MNTIIPHLHHIETYETIFKSLFVEWKEINGEIIVPFIIIPEEYSRYKNFKLIQIAMMNDKISSQLSTFYKDVTDFFNKYAEYFAPLTTFYYIQKDRITETQKIIEFIKYKKIQYKSKTHNQATIKSYYFHMVHIELALKTQHCRRNLQVQNSN